MAVNHNSFVTSQRGGAFQSGSSAAGGNLTSQKIDTPEYSRHNLSHKVSTSIMPCVLYPLDTMATLSGDHIQSDLNLTAMFMPTNKPFLDEFEMVAHQYFMPKRLLDPTFEMFTTGSKDGTYKHPRPNIDLMMFSEYQFPAPTDRLKLHQTLAAGYGGLCDMFNMPKQGDYAYIGQQGDGIMPVSTDKFIMYQRLYNDFYRVPELETDLFLDIPLTPDEVANDLVKRMINGLYEKHSTWSANDWFNSTGNPLYEKGRAEMFEFANRLFDNDGYFWRFFEWLLKNPSSITVNDTMLLPVLKDASNHTVWSNERACISIAPMYVDGAIPPQLALGTIASYINEDGRACTSLSSATELCTLQASGVLYSDAENIQESYIREFFDVVFAYLIRAWVYRLVDAHFMAAERDKYNIALPYTMRGRGAILIKNIVTEQNIIAGNNVYSRDALSAADIYGTYGDTLAKTLYPVYAAASTSTSAAKFNLESYLTQNDLRNLRAATNFLEKSAKFGYRYSEYIRGMFGVTSDIEDYSRPHYLGGLKTEINSNRITNMSGVPDDNNNVQIGQWSGEAGANVNGSLGNWECAEEGYIMTLMCVKPRTIYARINDPENCKLVDRTQTFTTDFAYIQEQPMSLNELNAKYYGDFALSLNGVGDVDPRVIGNVPRYNEYRQIPSVVHGDFLKFVDMAAFTTARDIADDATLEDLQVISPIDENIQRLFQVSVLEQNPIIVEAGFGVDATRLVPAFTATL